MSIQAEAERSRVYTSIEVGVDCAVHLLGLLGSVAGGVVLILMAAHGSAAEIATAAVYVGGLLAMFTCSGVYNLWRSSPWRLRLQGLDHSAIFLMIAGSYTPFSVLLLPPAWAFGLTALVWGVAAAGIAIRMALPRLFVRIRLVLYLALGWAGLAAFGPLGGVLDGSTIALLLAGGCAYTVGVVFHLWTRLPFQNAIWHGFVLAGATLHYFAVVNGLVAAGEHLRTALALAA